MYVCMYCMYVHVQYLITKTYIETHDDSDPCVYVDVTTSQEEAAD